MIINPDLLTQRMNIDPDPIAPVPLPNVPIENIDRVTIWNVFTSIVAVIYILDIIGVLE